MLMIDKERICIYDYYEVLMMDTHFFKIQMPDYNLIIRGENLQIEYDENRV